MNFLPECVQSTKRVQSRIYLIEFLTVNNILLFWPETFNHKILIFIVSFEYPKVELKLLENLFLLISYHLTFQSEISWKRGGK